MMEFDTALRLTEVLLGLAMAQQSAEHLTGSRADRWLFGLRLVLCGLLVAGLYPIPVLGALCALALMLLHRFQGPYNGGADKMTLLILTCLTLARTLPDPAWQELALAYLAVQVVLSYVVSGWIKLVNPDWRSGRALVDVFAFSAYPVSQSLRGWADRPRALWVASWGVIGFELAFPLGLLHPGLLVVALSIAALFHLANAFVFGLNRFFWIWLCAYPSLIWFQGRAIAPLL